MSNSYEPIPGAGSSGDRPRNIIFIALGVMAGLGVLLVKKADSGALDVVNWPEVLMKMDNSTDAGPFQHLGTNTKEATAKGWLKSDEPCNPLLGEAWMYGGKRSKKYNGVVYMTPAVGEVAGVVSGIEADYYDYVEEKLIGKYFGEEKTSDDGKYRSISIALRDGEKENLCDKKTAVAPGNAPYVRVAPGMANMNVPIVEDAKELVDNYKQGSCISSMGNHWATDVEGGKDLTYKAENLVPVVAMYSTADKTLNAIFFTATARKQTGVMMKTSGNMWDFNPGLMQKNVFPFYMCSNFCGEECNFTGTEDGWFTTMHWMFKDTHDPKSKDYETCGGKSGAMMNNVCPKGDYPTLA